MGVGHGPHLDVAQRKAQRKQSLIEGFAAGGAESRESKKGRPGRSISRKAAAAEPPRSEGQQLARVAEGLSDAEKVEQARVSWRRARHTVSGVEAMRHVATPMPGPSSLPMPDGEGGEVLGDTPKPTKVRV